MNSPPLCKKPNPRIRTQNSPTSVSIFLKHDRTTRMKLIVENSEQGMHTVDLDLPETAGAMARIQSQCTQKLSQLHYLIGTCTEATLKDHNSTPIVL